MKKYVTIHCQPAIEDYLVNSSLYWLHNNEQDVNEIAVIVEDVESLEDNELCTHYGINYDLVNCIETI